jgi:hypothetical protein
MVSDIFNSILFGALHPNQVLIADDRYFSDLLNQAPSLKQDKVQSLHSRIHKLLRDHKSLWIFPENNLNESIPLSIRPLYDLTLPAPFNNGSRFYAELIKTESLRYINNLGAGVSKCPSEVDSRYLVNSALRDLKYFAKNASIELANRGFLNIPNYGPNLTTSNEDAANQLIHYVFYLLKIHTSALVFEVQELFGMYAKSIDSFEAFFISTLKETCPDESVFQKSAFYFENKINQFLISGTANQETATELLHKQEDQFSSAGTVATTAITALENYIFIKQFELPVENTEFANLANSANPANPANLLTSLKEFISSAINQKTYGHERFEIVSENLEKLIFLKESTIQGINHSAPRKLFQWLTIQSEAYRGNLSNSFAVVDPADKHRTKKSPPLPIQDKVSTEELKSQAQEFLKHFKGYNISNEKIMTVIDFNHLMEYTYFLIEHEEIPTDIIQIPQIRLSNGHIRYTFYLMHQSFYGTKEIKPSWISFLKAVFSQFDIQEWVTLKTKFSVKPAKYEADLRILNSN